MTFRKALLEELAAIPWLDDDVARGYLGALGDGHDVAARALKDAVLLRDPLLAPSDALPALGRDRGIHRPPPLNDGQYAQWLSGAIAWWQSAGLTAGYNAIFGAYGFAADQIAILSNHEASGHWDGNAGWHSRVFVLIDSHQGGAFRTDGLWNAGGTWSDESGPLADTWNSNAKVQDIDYFRAAILATKADDAYPVTIAVWLQGDGSLPDGYWDSPGLWSDGGDWSDLGLEVGVYWTLGHVWGDESWLGGAEVWTDGPAGAPVPGYETWNAYEGKEA